MRALLRILTATLMSVTALHQAAAQTTTTNTNCTLAGNTANCTSKSTSSAAQDQHAYEAGQQVGNAIGLGIASAVNAHKQAKWVKNFCTAHPGSSWKGTNTATGVMMAKGRCPTDDDKGVAAANVFMSKHKDYVREQANSDVLTAYLETHNLDPREAKSYERGYKQLKKAGLLHLYTR